MNINEVIEAIENINCEMNLDPYFESYATVELRLVTTDDDGDVEITGGYDCVGSWRGVYSEPCLFIGDNTCSQGLLKELYFLKSGNKFNGWKGDKFSYCGSNELNMEDEERSWSGDGYIDSVKYDQKRDLIVITCTKEI